MNDILVSYKNNNQWKSTTKNYYINNVQKWYFPVFPTSGILDRVVFHCPVITTLVFPGQP
jgi:hypothetical protein